MLKVGICVSSLAAWPRSPFHAFPASLISLSFTASKRAGARSQRTLSPKQKANKDCHQDCDSQREGIPVARQAEGPQDVEVLSPENFRSTNESVGLFPRGHLLDLCT